MVYGRAIYRRGLPSKTTTANWDADALMTSIKEGTEEDNKTARRRGFRR